MSGADLRLRPVGGVQSENARDQPVEGGRQPQVGRVGEERPGADPEPVELGAENLLEQRDRSARFDVEVVGGRCRYVQPECLEHRAHLVDLRRGCTELLCERRWREEAMELLAFRVVLSGDQPIERATVRQREWERDVERRERAQRAEIRRLVYQLGHGVEQGADHTRCRRQRRLRTGRAGCRQPGRAGGGY